MSTNNIPLPVYIGVLGVSRVVGWGNPLNFVVKNNDLTGQSDVTMKAATCDLSDPKLHQII